ncbi:NAD(P)/FAD-dependent oxidoreductase [Spirosoma luteum]|uniref:NAD(P)/FAD-dependent oxidoreductase n=1 Tax=Spirosoma luteum TaxID=431553 RepID=UPI00037FE3D2|nr:NAD(P)/FAD-dependent oxidoreductase [Spirosoma luteum]
MDTQTEYDVVIVGGSVAGLSAALVLGRSLRRVLVVDSGKPCNRQTPHSHSFMTRDGETPAQLTSLAREQALAYPTVQYLNGRVTTLSKNADGFALTTDSQTRIKARKVLLATGLEDIMSPIDGFAESWGVSVLHCPYCHGYEVRNQPLGVLITGEHTADYVGLIHHWSQNLTLFTNGSATLTDDQRGTISRLNVPIIETPIAQIKHEQGLMNAVMLQDGSQVDLTALFAPVPFRQHSDLAQQLGCTLTSTGLIQVTIVGQTNVPGLFAAGDNSSPMRQLAVASANGVAAGAGINRELVTEEVAVY